MSNKDIRKRKHANGHQKSNISESESRKLRIRYFGEYLLIFMALFSFRHYVFITHVNFDLSESLEVQCTSLQIPAQHGDLNFKY
jgi:hypothetical protein